MDCCLYCERKFKAKISRHYSAMHSGEKLVQNAIINGKNCKKPSYKLQQLGNYKYNCKVSYLNDCSKLAQKFIN